MTGSTIAAAQVVVRTSRFDDDLAALLDIYGFRIDTIFPADAPTTAVVSGHGVRLRLESSTEPHPITLRVLTDDVPAGRHHLPGGSAIEVRPFTTGYELPEPVPSLTITHPDDGAAAGRAGMLYRDLIPDRWGGSFIASHITIPDGGPVPDYVRFHKVRFQMIFVKAGWVRVVYEDQGDPFVMHAGDCVLQPPQIRHRVLESSPGLEVIEVGCPAVHETIADWALPLPNGHGDPLKAWEGSRFVRHVAEGAAYGPWRAAGWECRDTGIGAATAGLADVRVARPTVALGDAVTAAAALGTEFALLVVLRGAVTFTDGNGVSTRLVDGASVAIPGDVAHRLVDATVDCELLDVTLPATAGGLDTPAAPALDHR
ncbi:MAG TPA: hypothetical protein VNQ73_10725 [Ilumatobacter sp.]|nr:hypothetical protein [Ilumatobacter sp.]